MFEAQKFYTVFFLGLSAGRSPWKYSGFPVRDHFVYCVSGLNSIFLREAVLSGVGTEAFCVLSLHRRCSII